MVLVEVCFSYTWANLIQPPGWIIFTRFMAGIYLGCGIISLWAGITVARQNTLVLLLALGIFLGGMGRLISISMVGLPEPAGLWIGYLVPELLLPVVMVVSQSITKRKLGN